MPRLADTLARLWARRAPMPAEEKASATGPLIVLETLGRPAWTPRDYEAFAREGFMQNAIVYRAVRMIAEAAASVPLLLFEGDQEHDDHPLLDLLARPSLDQTGTDFLEAWYGYLLVAGNAYVEAVALDGRLRELHALRPDRMQVVPGAEGWRRGAAYGNRLVHERGCDPSPKYSRRRSRSNAGRPISQARATLSASQTRTLPSSPAVTNRLPCG